MRYQDYAPQQFIFSSRPQTYPVTTQNDGTGDENEQLTEAGRSLRKTDHTIYMKSVHLVCSDTCKKYNFGSDLGHSFIHSFIHSFVRSFVRSFFRSFVRSFVRSFTQSVSQSVSLAVIRPVSHKSVSCTMGQSDS